MIIEIKGKDVELKYTFNSFKFMEDLDLGELEELERKPFKMISITQTLLLGALNNHPSVKYSDKEVSEIFENQVEGGSIVELLESLIELLQESSFFKNLQQTAQEVEE